MMTFTKKEILKELDREIGMRGAVYTRRVLSGKMLPREMEEKIMLMRAAKKIVLMHDFLELEITPENAELPPVPPLL